MSTEFETKQEYKVDIHYVRGVPCIVQEIDGYYYDHYDDFELAEVLQDQETVYQSLMRSRKKDGADPSSSREPPAPKTDPSGTGILVGLSEETVNIQSQLELDEAVARALQEAENQLSITSLNVTEPDSSSANHQAAPTTSGSSSSDLVAREDDIDPDNMTYEELQSLGEVIGSESKGLTDELISYLPTSKYKSGFFSRKDKSECVICCMVYKNRDVLITLPCNHEYHSKCISKWLKINKACPVCNNEVFGS